MEWRQRVTPFPFDKTLNKLSCAVVVLPVDENSTKNVTDGGAFRGLPLISPYFQLILVEFMPPFQQVYLLYLIQ